jgi:hypothetical protein
VPPILFIITTQPNDRVVYHCHNLLELFRLREVYQPDLHAEVYRYVDTKVSVQTDKYFQWDKDKLIWVAGSEVGFQRITYASLEPIYNVLRQMK